MLIKKNENSKKLKVVVQIVLGYDYESTIKNYFLNLYCKSLIKVII